MNRHVVVILLLGVYILLTALLGFRFKNDITTLQNEKKQTTIEIGLLRGELNAYKVINLNTWKKQVIVNTEVRKELGKINVLRSPRFTIESKDE